MKKSNSFLLYFLIIVSGLLFACNGNNSTTTNQPKTAAKSNKTAAEDQATKDNLGKPTTYEVAIRTGCKESADTKAAVYLKITGEAGSSEDFLLTDPTSETFRNCSNDVFKLSVQKDLGDIQQLELWHDNAGEDPSWLVELIKVKNARTSVGWMFPCGKWFDNDKFDEKIRRKFYPGKHCD